MHSPETLLCDPCPRFLRSFHEAKDQEVRVWRLALDVVDLGLGQQMS